MVQMNARRGLPILSRCLTAWLGLSAVAAIAHTLPISYLQLTPDEDYLHLELVFNPFEMTFMSELDDNEDGELNHDELAAHGQALADRVAASLKLSVAGRDLLAETAGMDPAQTGHHVSFRAHYKVDARGQPLTLETDLISLTSASHLTQVTYATGSSTQRAQLDSRSRKVTFVGPPIQKAASSAAPSKALPMLLVGLAALCVLMGWKRITKLRSAEGKT